MAGCSMVIIEEKQEKDGSKWNRYDSYVNTGSKKYKRATKAKVNYPFWVCCTGAVIPTYSGSISFALKTK